MNATPPPTEPSHLPRVGDRWVCDDTPTRNGVPWVVERVETITEHFARLGFSAPSWTAAGGGVVTLRDPDDPDHVAAVGWSQLAYGWRPAGGCERGDQARPSGSPLEYEQAAGVRVHRDGRYRFRCTVCHRDGLNDGMAIRRCELSPLAPPTPCDHVMERDAQRASYGTCTKCGAILLGPSAVSPSQPPPSPERDVCAASPKVALFVGVDPGRRGAAAVLSVRSDVSDEATHGQVVGVRVFDLPQRIHEGGGASDLDVVGFQALLVDALSDLAGEAHGAVPVRAVVERPEVGGGARFGARSLVSQAVNVGAVWACVVGVCSSAAEGADAVVEWASSRSRGGWRDEVGCEKGKEAEAVMAMLTATDLREREVLLEVSVPDELRGAFTHEVAADARILRDARPDRLVAVLLADLGRRRWLGTTASPAKGRGGATTARAARARKADRRKEAVARAVAPLTVAKARALALTVACPTKDHGPDRDGAVPGEWCLPRNSCCEGRLLEWAWRQRPDLPEPPVPTTSLAWVLVEMARAPLPRFFKRAVNSKTWSLDLGGLVSVADGVVDLFLRHGLVQLTPGVKDVEYQPTPRGLGWARRLRGGAATGGEVVS